MFVRTGRSSLFLGALFTLCLVAPAFGFTPAADCDCWSVFNDFGDGFPGGMVFATATLEVDDNGTWVVVEQSMAMGQFGPGPVLVEVGNCWDSAPLPTGSYRVAVHVSADLDDGTSFSLTTDPVFFVCDGPPPPPDGEGCTPGFWKGPQHFEHWVGYTIDDSYEAIFGVDAMGDMTLLDALNTGGGGERKLLRHSVAALLNASNPDVAYAYTEAEVIALVQAAYASGDFNGIAELFVIENELGCLGS